MLRGSIIIGPARAKPASPLQDTIYKSNFRARRQRQAVTDIPGWTCIVCIWKTSGSEVKYSAAGSLGGCKACRRAAKEGFVILPSVSPGQPFYADVRAGRLLRGEGYEIDHVRLGRRMAGTFWRSNSNRQFVPCAQ